MSRKSFKDKPHITNGIKISIKHRDKLYKKYLNNPNDINKAVWRKFRNKTNEVIKKAEQLYYSKQISNHNNNCRELWKTFGKILNKNKIKHNTITTLNINNKIISNKNHIVEEFNKYFCQVGETLASRFDGINNDYANYLSNPAQQSIHLYKISPNEILTQINNLKDSNSTGSDEISTRFIKLSGSILIPALEYLFNLVISKGEYPDSLKIAKVIPIFKSGDPSKTNNYRPISVLCSINKILEKILHKRLTDYLEKFKLLYKYQYGFRKGHSTIHAITEMVDNIKLSMDNNKLTCGIFVDLSTAFNTVNHNILLAKLNHYGIRGTANKLFKSYLSNRKQFVQINEHKSSTQGISCGVPQGSVLGPLLFLLFINDLHICCPSGAVRIFADDTSVFFSCSDIDKLVTKAQEIMMQLHNWFHANKLTLNTNKSNFVIFRSPRHNIINVPEKISFLNTEIVRANQVKYLGLILDENLNWNAHISSVCSKLKRYFKVFYSIRNFLTKQHITTIYYTLIYSHVKYGLSIYGFTNKKNLDKLQKVQNQLLKVLTKKKYRYSTNMLHNDLNILKVNDIKTLEILTFVHNFFSNKLPSAFDNYFTTFADLHSINTRNKNKRLIVANHRTNFGANTVKIKGTILWNNLNVNLRSCNNIKRFRREWKAMVLPYNLIV